MKKLKLEKNYTLKGPIALILALLVLVAMIAHPFVMDYQVWEPMAQEVAE